MPGTRASWLPRAAWSAARWSGSRRSRSPCCRGRGRACARKSAHACGERARRPGWLVDHGHPPITNSSAVTGPARPVGSTIVISTRAWESPITATCGTPLARRAEAARPIGSLAIGSGAAAVLGGSSSAAASGDGTSVPSRSGLGQPFACGSTRRGAEAGRRSWPRVRCGHRSVRSTSRVDVVARHHAEHRQQGGAPRRRTRRWSRAGQPEVPRLADRVLDPPLGQRGRGRSSPSGSRPGRAWSAGGRWRRAAG